MELELYWPERQHSISTHSSVTALSFPTLDVNLSHTDNLVAGERVIIGSAEVKVNGQAYGIPVHDLSADISSDSAGGVIELMPRADGWLNSEHAWAFDIVFTPNAEERHTLLFHLDMDYAGREYNFMTDSFVLSSVIAPLPTVPQHQIVYIEKEVPAPAPAPPPVVIIEQPPEPEESGDFPLMLAIYSVAGVIVTLIVAAGAYVAYGLTRPNPFGYIYDDEGNMLVDLSTIERPFLTLVTSKNLLRGEETGVPELEGLSFYFNNEEVDIRSAQTEPSIRVNNRPLIDGQETRSLNQSWIGTQGKLFSLHLTKPVEDEDSEAQPSAAPTAADAPAVGDD